MIKIRFPFKYLLVVVFSILIFLLVGEVLIRLYLHSRIIYDIEMSRYSMAAKADSPNSKIEHVHKPNVRGKFMGVHLRTNSDGLRDDEYPVGKTGKYRIIFLGDSLTLGWGVEEKDTFEKILESKLNQIRPTEILNFGIGNFNTEQEVNLFLEKGLKYEPDQAVLFYFINDAEPTPKKSKLWFLGYSQIITFYWSRIHAVINRFVLSTSFGGYYSNLYREDQPGWTQTMESFSALKKICAERSIKLQVVLLPELHYLKEYPFKKEYQQVSALLAALGIEHLDLTPFFKNIENPMELWVAKDDAHPNAKAHRLIAEDSFDMLSKPLQGKA